MLSPREFVAPIPLARVYSQTQILQNVLDQKHPEIAALFLDTMDDIFTQAVQVAPRAYQKWLEQIKTELAAELVFDEPQRALTPGQICALYDGEQLLGGGVFEEIEYS